MLKAVILIGGPLKGRNKIFLKLTGLGYIRYRCLCIYLFAYLFSFSAYVYFIYIEVYQSFTLQLLVVFCVFMFTVNLCF